MTRRNCLPASTIPAAHQRSAICPSRHRLTLREWSRLIEIIQRMRQAYHADSALPAQALLEKLAAELDKTHPGR